MAGDSHFLSCAETIVGGAVLKTEALSWSGLKVKSEAFMFDWYQLTGWN